MVLYVQDCSPCPHKLLIDKQHQYSFENKTPKSLFLLRQK
jgi:hypothetical protein